MQAMRRAVLATAVETAPERRRAFRLAPAFAACAVAVLSLVVGLSLWRMHGPEPGQPISPTVPVVPAFPVAPAPAVPSPDVVAVVSPPPPVHAVRRKERRPRVAEMPAVPPAVPSLAPEPEMAEAAAPARQVQFSAPGGTRIIWLLPAR
jgi:hypothetical protein